MGGARVGGRTAQGSGWALIVVWALLAMLLDVVWLDLYDRLSEIALIFPFALWLGAVWLAGAVAARGIRERAWTPAVLLLTALVSVGILQGLGGRKIGLLARFQAMKPRYRAIVRAIESGEIPPASGCRHIVEKGPPVRVAFPWPGGILDNWCGVVYDPSGLVRKASLFKPDLSNFGDPALQEAKRLFGGDLRSCDPLGGDWYFCCFT